ncbi:MAG: RNA polymerase sigma factor [Crocinitomicaceae bacterium]|nr:RNA polymerase sigma factor [Crocinitomicaceae bacterium]
MHIHVDILKDCVDNDRRAQKQLYEYCFRQLMPLCLRYHTNEEDARSSLNIAFLKIVKGLKELDLDGLNFNAWSKRVTNNTLIDEYRKRKNQSAHYVSKETDRELDFYAEGIHNDAISDFGCDTILQMLKEIPASSAHVFNLYVIDGYNHREIGELLEMSEGTSKWHLSTARKLLREKLEKIELEIPRKLVM